MHGPWRLLLQDSSDPSTICCFALLCFALLCLGAPALSSTSSAYSSYHGTQSPPGRQGGQAGQAGQAGQGLSPLACRSGTKPAVDTMDTRGGEGVPFVFLGQHLFSPRVGKKNRHQTGIIGMTCMCTRYISYARRMYTYIFVVLERNGAMHGGIGRP